MNKSEQLIACLEGEIAKRDARIMGLESQYQRDVYGLNNEGDPIGGDPAGGYANDNARLRAELAAIKAQEPLTVEFMQFMTAVVTGAGLLSRGKQSKGLASELSATAYKYMLGAQVSGYQQKPIGYRCWFNKEPKNIMVEWGKSLPSDMNPSATYQAIYAAPVSEAKAQGVVLPERELFEEWADEKGFCLDCKFFEDGNNYESDDTRLAFDIWTARARLNAAPVQQVSVPVACSCGREYPANSYSAGFISGSGMCEECDAAMPPKDIPQLVSVPDVSAMARILADRNADACNVNREDNWAIYGQDYIDDVTAMLAAAPAAPAADAGIVDMYRHLQKVTPYRFKKIQDASITDGGDVMYFHKDRFDAALLADMAAHCAAKGVV